MTTIAARIGAGQVDAPDLLCGGTPCQSFSVAGLRKSLDDARGNLALEFIRIADAIDRVRRAAGKPAAWVLWENVPGVLSTKDNAFGAFLGGLCGCDSAIDAPADGWPSAGVVAGPGRVAAWRVLDAQFFGVAQRRKRVFVLALAGAGGWACADALLPVSDRMLWHPAPSRETRAGVAVGALAGTSPGGGWRVGADEAAAGQLVAFGGNNRSGAIDVAAGLNAKGGVGRMDFDSETFIAHSLRGEGFDASEDGTGRGTPLAPVAFAATDYETGAFDQVDAAGPLTTSADRTRSAPILAFDTFNQVETGDVTQTLCSRGDSPGGNAHLVPAVQTAMQVRRLTPRECERLQGFPDDYTLIPHRGRDAADGPRYKALGNSWAVPCVRWIGQRIDACRHSSIGEQQ
jgi:DNA (cytosine-5)-methyltransferase 1